MEVDIGVDMKEVSWNGMDWIWLDQDMVVAVPFEHNNEPLGSHKMQEFLDWLAVC